MPPSWRSGLVTAYPVPKDKRKIKKREFKLTKDVAKDSGTSEPSCESAPDPFQFLSLPAEIRSKIYHLLLFPPPRTPFDPKPKPGNGHALALLRTSHLIHSETTYILYTHTPFPLFPIQAFPQLPTPLLIPPRHRPTLKALHLRLGNSWSAPPKAWRVSKLLARALPRFISLRTLKVFVEVDPSEPIFEKYRVSKDYYTEFAGGLLADVLKVATQVEVVEVGGYEFVNVAGPLVSRIKDVVLMSGKELQWSEENGFKEKVKKSAKGEVDVG